jgi:hypothetical protein
MGIEPTREASPELENKRFGATTHPKCDWGVNIRGMWGHVGIREKIGRRPQMSREPVPHDLEPCGGRTLALPPPLRPHSSESR